MPGETDLATLIASMRPRLDPAVYVWATVDAVPAGLAPVAIVREDEGLAIVITRDDALRVGIEYTFPSARITLEVHSALEAVGLTAAFSAALAAASVSANVVAGFHHDHIFVPLEKAAEAVAALEQLAISGR